MLRKAPVVLVALVASLLPATGRAAVWTARPAQYPKVAVQRDVPVKMGDGVTLYADVIRPADANGNAAPGRFSGYQIPAGMPRALAGTTAALQERANWAVSRQHHGNRH